MKLAAGEKVHTFSPVTNFTFYFLPGKKKNNDQSEFRRFRPPCSPLKTRFRVQEQDTGTRPLFLYVFWGADNENRGPEIKFAAKS